MYGKQGEEETAVEGKYSDEEEAAAIDCVGNCVDDREGAEYDALFEKLCSKLRDSFDDLFLWLKTALVFLDLINL